MLSVGVPEGGAVDERQVKVFEWNGSAWVVKRDPISGTINGDDFGIRQQLNDAGDVIAIGSPAFGMLRNKPFNSALESDVFK